jgi:hypothetical protein
MIKRNRPTKASLLYGGKARMWIDFLIANVLWAPACIYGAFQFWNYMQ